MVGFIVIAELVVLYFLSRRLNQAIFSLFYLLTRSEHIALVFTTLLLFPGTVVHELSHLFTAEIMGVRTGKLTLIPKRINEGHVQAGSVMVEKTDPFRSTLIGLAPIFVGIICITLLSIQLTRMFPEIQRIFSTPQPFGHPTLYLFILVGYLLFSISNNMFSSKEDLHGVTPVLIFTIIIVVTTYLVGFRIQLTGAVILWFEFIMKTLMTNLGIVLGLNLLLMVFLYLLISLFRKT